MNNPYCASFETVRDLYVEHTKNKSRENYDNATKELSREAIKRQLDTQSGALIDGIRDYIKETTKHTEFVEFLAAVQLADFYFPNTNKDICFELKRDIKPESIKSYQDLTDGFESGTHIDCQVRSGEQMISFQIKRDHSDHTPVGFANWLNEKVFKKYGDMSGVTLVVFLGAPADNSVIELDKLYSEFTKNCLTNISFDKVCLLYHDGGSKHMVLHEFYPNQHLSKIDRDLAIARFRGEA